MRLRDDEPESVFTVVDQTDDVGGNFVAMIFSVVSAGVGLPVLGAVEEYLMQAEEVGRS